MRSCRFENCRRLCGAGLLVTAAASPAYGHGGMYGGPGASGGPSTPAGGGPSSTSAGSPVTDTGAWDLWWSLNRERWLRRVAAQRAGAPTTGSDEFFLGVGSGQERTLALLPSPDTIHQQVVPALLSALEDSENVDLVSALLLALAKVGNPPELDLAPVLGTRLEDSNQELHETAALSLGVLGAQSAVTTLTHLLHDDEQGRAACKKNRVPERTRAFAAYGLGLIGHRSEREAVRGFVVHHLSQALAARRVDDDVAVACVLSLGLVRLRDGEVLQEGEPVSAARSRQGQMQLLLEIYRARDTRDAVRAQVPVAFARLLPEADPHLRAEAAGLFVQALGARKTPASLQLGLVQALGLMGDDDEDPEDVEMRRALEQAARGAERSVRHVALISLARCAARGGSGPPGEATLHVRRTLLERLARGTDAERPWAGLALAILEAEGSAPGRAPADVVLAALRHALENDAGPQQAGAYCIALGLLADSPAAPAIQEVLRAGDENLRGYAAIALGLLGDRSSLPLLREVALRDTRYRPALLREVAIALALLGDREIVPQLLQRLRAGTTMVDTVSSASALGFVGDARAVGPLLEILSDGDQRAIGRAFAAVALGMICDKEALPWNAKLAADSNWLAAPPTLYDPLLGKGVLDLL